MYNLSNKFYHAAIKSVFPDVNKIETPVNSGAIATVFICHTNCGIRVCRFNEKQIILRNQKTSKILCDYGVPIKRTSVYEYNGQYFESYAFDPHQTLKEVLPEMSSNEIFDAYKSALNILAHLVSFPIQKFSKIDNPYFTDVYALAVPRCINNSVMQCVYRMFYKCFSGGKNMYVVHPDLTPANMLIADDHRRIVRLIDLDTVSICNENVAVFGMLRLYPLSNIKELIEYYQDISGHKLNYPEIICMLKLFQKTANLRGYLHQFSVFNIIKQH